MSAIGNQTVVERYAQDRVNNGECIDIYYNCEKDEWIAAGNGSNPPQEWTYFGTWHQNRHGKPEFTLKSCE